MYKFAVTIFVAAVVVLLGWAFYQVVYVTPLLDSFDQTNHLYLIVAYTITWLLQLGYLAFLGMRWRTQRGGPVRTPRG
jgi:hypothetical protein